MGFSQFQLTYAISAELITPAESLRERARLLHQPKNLMVQASCPHMVLQLLTIN
jgi:hypothetical protein